MKLASMLFLALLSVLLASCGPGAGGNRQTRLTSEQIAARSEPATVEVIAQFEASGVVAELVPDVDRLFASVPRREISSITTREEAARKLFNIFYADPGSYLKEGELKNLDQKVYALGTGFIVTPDGYILTNAHVVKPEDDELKEASVDSVQALVDDEASKMEQAVQSVLPGSSLAPEATDRLKKVLAEQYAKRGQFQFKREVHVLLPSAHAESAHRGDERVCEIRKIGEPTPGKDVAILKIEGTDLPTVPLAESLLAGEVRTGANLYVLGYPGSVALYPSFSKSGGVQPSLTRGVVSNVKDMAGGWQVIQTDAAVNPGNSGGPTFNEQGQVVGLATFGLKESQGVNFAVSVDLAREFLRDMNVTPKESQFTKEYDQALEQFDRGDNGEALRMFKALSARHPDLSLLRDRVAELAPGGAGDSTRKRKAVTKSEVGQARSRRISTPIAILAGVALLLVVVVVGVILVNRT